MSILRLALLALVCVACAGPVGAADRADGQTSTMTFTTLGTASGPIPNIKRSQPANVLRYERMAFLVDVGDGAVDQLARAGLQTGQIQAVFLTHLHFDHTGGLFAFLGRRYQARYPDAVTIYGPPGTRATVEALVAAMQPMAHNRDTFVTKIIHAKPGDNVTAVDVVDGSQLEIGGIKVTATVNTHYVLSDAEGKGSHGLSFRFDAPGRSIVYTGDTGPSANVEKLAQGVDLLVTEIMDPDEAFAKIKETRPEVGTLAQIGIKRHFRHQHLSPLEVGLMAARSNAKRLVLTHNALDPASIERAKGAIAKNYKGPVAFAEDLQAF